MRIQIYSSGQIRDLLGGRSPFTIEYDEPISIDKIIMSLGIPQNEIGFVLINGKFVELGHLPSDGDSLTIIPVIVGG